MLPHMYTEVCAAISCGQGWQSKGYISWLLPFMYTYALLSVKIQNSLKAPSKISYNGQKVPTLEWLKHFQVMGASSLVRNFN